MHYKTFGTHSVVDEDGLSSDIWMMSISLYTSIIILVSLKLALNTQYWTMLTWIGLIITSLGAYFVYISVSNVIPLFIVYQTATQLVKSPLFYLSVSFSVLSVFMVDLVIFSLKISKDNLLNYMKKSQRLN